MTAPNDRFLTLDRLRALIDAGEVDTVVMAFTDMQGRLVGKRIHAQFFVDEVIAHGTEGCNYLLAVDVEMDTVDGYAMSSWGSGYGDMVMAPDMRTLRALDPARLDDEFPQRIHETRLPTRMFLLHLATHLSYHLGQVDYHRRLTTGLGTTVASINIPALVRPFPEPAVS
jgi:hypothetical protein